MHVASSSLRPAALVEQWRDELFEKFGLEFHIYSALLTLLSPSGNPFDDYHQLIVRLDQLSRNEDLQDKLCAAGWDLVVFDEAQVPIPNEPDSKAMLEFEPQQRYAITDVKYYKGEVYVSGITNQRFASTLYRIPYPFNSRMSTCTVEIWHPVHGQFETRAPIIRHVIRELNGTPYLFGVYGCTPLVRFPLSSLKDGAHVHGDVIGELGYGANPLDMLTFTSPADSKDYLLVTIDTRSASQIAVADLASAPPQPTGGGIDFGPGGLGRTQRALPIKAEHIAILNPKWAIVVWRHPRTSYRLDLSTLALPYFFERKDGMSEMNWPNGPDPFQYREHRNELSNQ
jgi:hypothetical protein